MVIQISDGFVLIDVGANLTDGMFQGIYRGKLAHPSDLIKVLERSKRVGIDRIMITSGTLSDVHDSLKLIDDNLDQPIKLTTTVGVHPTRCLELEHDPSMMDRLKSVLEEQGEHVSAVGEFGLDYDRLEFCPRDIQLKWFEKQFELVEAVKKPLFLHMRAACDDFVKIIREQRHKFDNGLVHSFTGTPEEAQQILAQNLYIGINGCSLRTPESLEVVKRIPLDKIMIESDAPWCDIRKTHAGYPFIKTHFNGVDKAKYKVEDDTMVKSRNEPLATRQVLEIIAELHGVSIEDAADIIYTTSTIVFI